MQEQLQRTVKSTSGGIKWVPIFDDGYASIGAVAVQQSNPDVIWVGTGEEIHEIVSTVVLVFIKV